MSYEAEQENQDDAGDGTENADDLSMALSGGETTFVSEGKQPVSKGTMVVAGLLIACGAVTYFMYMRNGPAEASAGPDSKEAIVKGFLDDPSRAKGWKDLIDSTDKVVKQFKQEPPQVQLADLSGNPFQVGESKPSVDMSAKRKLEEIERAKAAAKEAIAELKLQTIIHRDPKKAAVMINNRMFRKGEKISVLEGKVVYVVTEIRPDGVTLSAPIPGAEPVSFELSMRH